jgi:hypothetical protein
MKGIVTRSGKWYDKPIYFFSDTMNQTYSNLIKVFLIYVSQTVTHHTEMCMLAKI